MTRAPQPSKGLSWRWLPALILTLGTLAGGALALVLIPERVGAPVESPPRAPESPRAQKPVTSGVDGADSAGTPALAPASTVQPAAAEATAAPAVTADPPVVPVSDAVAVPASPPSYVLPPPPAPPATAPPPLVGVNGQVTRPRSIRARDAE